MKILFVQTADVADYRLLLDITSASFREYCSLHGHSYECYLGIRQGAKPWHAALNRIPMLKDLLVNGFSGWVVYADADAYVADLSFDLEAYLATKSDYALIAAPSGVQPPRWWDINNGVFCLNLSHESGKQIVRDWFDKLSAIPASLLNQEEWWGQVVDDQRLLHDVLKERPDEYGPVLYLDQTEPKVFNWHGDFIRQVVRGFSGSKGAEDFRLRAVKLAAEVSKVLRTEQAPNVRRMYEEFATALYRVLLGREPDKNGLDHAVKVLLDGDRTFASQLRATLSSEEFAKRADSFIKHYTVKH